MVLRLLALPAVAAAALTLSPRPEPARKPAAKQPAPAAGVALDRAEWGVLLAADPVAALRASRARYTATVNGFRCVLVKQERLDGVLHPSEVIDVLARERPYAVRMVWREGARRVMGVAVQGTLYAAGEDAGRMTVWRPDALASFLRFYHLDPAGSQARGASRYGLTEAGLGQTLDRTIAAWGRAQARGDRIEHLGLVGVPELGGKRCYALRRVCSPPETDRFLVADPAPAGEQFDAATIILDPQTQFQVGAEVSRGGAVVGRYFLRDVQINPTLTATDFTQAAFGK
jgi:hypothetical protein